MPTYEVKLKPNTPGLTLAEGHNVMLVEAADATDARAIAAGHYDGDASGAWASSGSCDVTEVTVASDLSPVTAAGKTTDYTLRIVITGADLSQTFEHTAAAAESVDDLWSGMVAVLNADAAIAGAAWASPNLTIAETTDNLGDHVVTVEVLYGDQALPSFVGAITDEGAEGAALSVAATAAPVIPTVRSYRDA